MSIRELHDEIIALESGDLWDGMSSSWNKKETSNARRAWDIKMDIIDRVLLELKKL